MERRFLSSWCHLFSLLAFSRICGEIVTLKVPLKMAEIKENTEENSRNNARKIPDTCKEKS